MFYMYPTYVRYTRNLFLRALCVVYLFAFTSLYIQIPGLFGTNGVLPARTQLDSGAKTIDKLVKPTLLWFAPSIGLDTEYMLDILALGGVVLSTVGFLSQKACTTLTFLLLWVFYVSIHQVGQTFMNTQWDALLIETGLLAVLLAPFTAKGSRTSGPVDAVIFFLVRWLLFRLTFSTGLLKLASGCFMWWELEALSHYFQIQPLPNAFSWYAHHLPETFLRLTTVFTISMETLVPCLYFFPVKSVHSVAFILQVFFQLSIFLTGNHSFHNILVITLSLSLIDDQFFNTSRRGGTSKLISRLACCAAYGMILYVVSSLFFFQFNEEAVEPLLVDLNLDYHEFDQIMVQAIPVMTYFASFTFAMTLMDAGLRSMDKVSSFLSVLFYGGLALLLFGLSIVPFHSIHPKTNSSPILYPLRSWYAETANWHFLNPYGAYKAVFDIRQKGYNIFDMKAERFEIVIEGSNSLQGPWLEYEFLFKPGNVNNTLPFAAPYEPRLDSQLVAAATTSFKSNPWLQSLTYRLLSGQAEVLKLIDLPRNPFPNKPPKYIKAAKYSYSFTEWSQRDTVTWWKREKIDEYMPVTSRDQLSLLNALTRMKILGSSGAEKGKVNPLVKLVLDTLRFYTSKVDPSFLPITLFIGGCIFIILPGSFMSSGKKRH